MACAQKTPAEYIRNSWAGLVNGMRHHSLIIENLYQQNVFNEEEVGILKAEKTERDKARCILVGVTSKGKEASYKLLRILDATKNRTLDPDLHSWISCFPLRVEDEETSCSFGK